MAKSIRIFLIDGYAVVREALRALIATTPDMEVVGDAADSTRALDQALTLKPDIVILDLSTLASGGINDGMQLVSSLINGLPQMRMLILTSQINRNEIVAAVEAGVKGYLLKGTAAPEILKAIRSVHRDESIIDPAVRNVLA